jgi:hypothetical protein
VKEQRAKGEEQRVKNLCPSRFALCTLQPNRVVFRVRVRGVSGNEVANPTERAASPKPKTGRENQPEDTCQYPAVIKLANPGNY